MRFQSLDYFLQLKILTQLQAERRSRIQVISILSVMTWMNTLIKWTISDWSPKMSFVIFKQIFIRLFSDSSFSKLNSQLIIFWY